MSWYNALNGYGFRNWLVAIGGRAQVRQGQRLDPFATSMRVFKYTAEKLEYIEQHDKYDVSGDTTQSIADLAAAGLVRRNNKVVTLTDIGNATLRGWRDAGIANDEDDDELPRCLVLVQKAHDIGSPFYIEMLNFWRQIREVYEPDSLIATPAALYLLSYLNQSQDDYNPWDIIYATRQQGIVGQRIDWDDLKKGTPNTAPDIDAAIGNLSRRIKDAATRSAGRINFCRAMELVVLSKTPAMARETLSRWSLAPRTQERCEFLLPMPNNIPNSIEERVEELNDLVLDRTNVILYGPPGTGKTLHAFALCSMWEEKFGLGTVFRTTFHPSYGYEDFVQGYRPDENNPGTFHKQEGILLRACNSARQLTANASVGQEIPKVLLVIDEINRGDVSRIFGELITYIESDKRDLPVYLAQSPASPVSIPANLYFLGTMNTADKSISLLDIALRRRFAFQEFPPEPSFFTQDNDVIEQVDGVALSDVLNGLNKRLLRVGIEADRSIGHALLKISSGTLEPIKALRKRFQFDIVPLIEEYSYGDRSRIRQILGDIVNSENRINISSTDKEFIQAVREIASIPTPAKTLVSVSSSTATPDETSDDDGGALQGNEFDGSI